MEEDPEVCSLFYFISDVKFNWYRSEPIWTLINYLSPFPRRSPLSFSISCPNLFL